MKRTSTLLSISLLLVLGFLVLAQEAFALSAGTYRLLIEPTPTKFIGESTAVTTKWKTGGIYNSSFSFGKLPGNGSQQLIDNPKTGNGYKGTGDTGILPNNFGDGWAGEITITVAQDESFIVNSYQVDVINQTAGGDFVEYGPVSSMSGQITGNDIYFDPTGRLGSTSAPGLVDRAWNIDDDTVPGTTLWSPVTTGTVSSVISGVVETISGTPIWTDTNGDMWATLVVGGQVGSAWGSFFGAAYFEVWKVKIEPFDPCSVADCDDGNVCTNDFCNVVGGVAVCDNPPNTAPCPDSDLCNGDELCSGGTCQPPVAPRDCDDSNVCTENDCDAIIGCLNTPLADLSACPDGNVTITSVPGSGEIRLWDWNFTGAGGRGPTDFDPINGFGGQDEANGGTNSNASRSVPGHPIPANPLDPNGGVGQVQHVVTQDPDWLTPDAPYDFWGDLFDLTTSFPNASQDATTSFYKSGYTTVGGSAFDPMYIDYDGDYLVPKAAMTFMFFDVFEYRDTTGTNPDLTYNSQADFQAFPISDGIGWCGSVDANHPVALEPMAGQIRYDIVFEAYFPFTDLAVYNGPDPWQSGDPLLADPGEGELQIIPDQQMRSYGTMEIITRLTQGGVADLHLRADAVVNNTSPALGRDATNPMGFSDVYDPTFYNHVAFHGGNIVPRGVWLDLDSAAKIGTPNTHDIVLHPTQGTDGTYDGEIRDPGGPNEAYWHENSFYQFPFMFRADAIRYPDFFDAAYYGADTDDDGVQDDANPNGDAVLDNCINVPNGPKVGMQDAGGYVQRDTNADGYGNICDADLNNDNYVNSLDLGMFKAAFMTSDADADLNGDGNVNSLDLGRVKALFMQPPGPSGVAP